MPGPVSLLQLLPEVILLTAACAVLLLAQSARESLRRSIPLVALVASAAALAVVFIPILLRAQWGNDDGQIRSGLAFGNFTVFVRYATAIVGALVVLVAWVQSNAAERGEFFSLILMSIAGVMLTGAASNLIILFLSLELVSIPTYALVALSRRNPQALEAGTKYFYLGALAAAITALGFSYLYGAAGSMTIDAAATSALVDALARPQTLAYGLATIGLVVSIGGLLFKIAAVPLHFYIADVYQGASSPVAGMLGFVPKFAGFIAIFKVVSLAGWQTDSGGLFWLLWIIAAVSMTLGNVLALRQTNIKRMLAYSGIAHSGYMLVGVLAGPGLTRSAPADGAAAVLYYMFIYGLANLGAFALLGLLRVGGGRPCETLRDVAGLLRRAPGPALLMALAMFTLMGLPPTAGFWGKVALFGSALSAGEGLVGQTQQWLIALVILGVVNSAIGAAYYLRVIAAVLLYENDNPAEPEPYEMPQLGAMMCGVFILLFAFLPGMLLTRGHEASQSMRAVESDLGRLKPPPHEADSGELAKDEQGAERSAVRHGPG